MSRYVRNLSKILNENPRFFDNINIEQFAMDVASSFLEAQRITNVSCVNLAPECIGYDEKENKFLICDWERIIRYRAKSCESSSCEFERYLLKILKNDFHDSKYLSPEILKCINDTSFIYADSHKSFGFSLGLVILDILNMSALRESLQFPTSNENDHTEKLQKILSKTRTTEKMKEVLEKMLSFDPSSRFSPKARS